MRCPSCQFENPAGMKFCGQCGTQLSNRCAQCGFENPPGFQFCGDCGARLTTKQKGKRGKRETGKRGNGETEKRKTKDSELPTLHFPGLWTPPHLAELIRAEGAALEARGAAAGERKIITSLFSDTAGFTALAHGLDPEAVRAIIDPALQIMMTAVHRYEGFVAQSLGDGIFALFGAPIAHEDHPQRALYAALLMQEEMRRYADQVRLEKGVPIQIRVGINTGEVVLRSIRKDDLHTDYLPVGHATNLASRMEGLASPGAIVVSENTYKLTEGYFEFRPLGAVQVKGLDEPVPIYEVLGVGPLRTRLQVAARRGLVRFVGRHNEMEQLQKALELSRAGQGQIVGVMGEPGVGKSRLFYEFVGATPASPLRQFILEKTEGNPFFMEEIVQDLFEQKVLVRDVGRVGSAHPTLTGALPESFTDLHIPTTVQAVLASRIDRLPAAEKELLQTLAVIGREFSLSLLKKVVEQPAEALLRLLSHLQAGEFIYEQLAFPEVEYTFKHALTQEVAHDSVLKERRTVVHERTAKAIEEIYHSQLKDHYGDLAHHYTRSGNTEKAVEYLHLAGQQAVQRSAYGEAITHLTTALDLLRTLPDTSEHIRQELTLQIALGVPLMATKGTAAPEVERVYTRARQLRQQVGETSQLFPVLLGLRTVYVVRGESRRAHELEEQLLTLAQSVQDPALLLLAHRVLGVTLFSLGELVSARAHLEQGIALYDPQQHRSLAFHYRQDPGVFCLSFTSFPLWFLGYPDQALKRSQAALTLAQELSHPHSLAFALCLAAHLHQHRRERQATQERAEAVITLSTEQGFPQLLALGTFFRGWALANQGQEEKGIAQMRQGLAAYRATGAELQRSHYLALLAEAHGKMEQTEEGLTLLAEALAVADKTGERFYEAELYRLKGMLTLQSKVQSLKSKVPSTQHLAPSTHAEAEAEACFQKAIEIARRQQAKSLELRATVSLARLWQSQGKHHAARNTLAEIYNWFTEGFDTADLKEAKALLEELQH